MEGKKYPREEKIDARVHRWLNAKKRSPDQQTVDHTTTHAIGMDTDHWPTIDHNNTTTKEKNTVCFPLPLDEWMDGWMGVLMWMSDVDKCVYVVGVWVCASTTFPSLDSNNKWTNNIHPSTMNNKKAKQKRTERRMNRTEQNKNGGPNWKYDRSESAKTRQSILPSSLPPSSPRLIPSSHPLFPLFPS